jgi:Cytochrome c7 and related cytochrome c/Doubled CXXCH motif (Paired_CXXCH_1)
MTSRLRVFGCALAALVLSVAGNAAAGGAAGLPAVASAKAGTSECLACHGQEGFQSESGRSLYINEKHFQGSVHAGLGCADCHSSIHGFPHPAHPQPVRCGNCHATEAEEIGESVHAHAAAPESGAQPCLSCHGNPHQILAPSNPGSTVYPLNVPRTCGACHGNPAIAKKYGFPNVYSLYIDSIHGFALTKDGLLVAATCSSCHGTHKILSRTNPQSRTYRTNIPSTCGSCHAGPKVAYFSGIHGRELEEGNPNAPVCSDCHTAHQISSVRAASWQQKTSATCGSCHKERYATYLDTFHAQVSALGYVETAHCWNCHQEHDILPASDPKSTVAPANLVTTCGHCHPGATASFVSYHPHADPRKRKAYPALYFTALFMNVLLLGVLSFFGLHTFLWFIHSVFDRRKGETPDETDA